MKYKKIIGIGLLAAFTVSAFGCGSKEVKDIVKNEQEIENNFQEREGKIRNSLSIDEILVQNHPILQEYVFQWLSWEDVSAQLTEDYAEWVSEEGANGRMVYRTVDGVTYILPEYWEGAEIDQISGILLTDEKYQLGCGLIVGMEEENLGKLDIPLQVYERDEAEDLKNKEAGTIALYKGMDNEDILEFDYAYSYDEGFVLDGQEQKRKIEELGLPEECYSDTHFQLIAFIKDEKVSGIFLGIIP